LTSTWSSFPALAANLAILMDSKENSVAAFIAELAPPDQFLFPVLRLHHGVLRVLPMGVGAVCHHSSPPSDCSSTGPSAASSVLYGVLRVLPMGVGAVCHHSSPPSDCSSTGPSAASSTGSSTDSSAGSSTAGSTLTGLALGAFFSPLCLCLTKSGSRAADSAVP